MNGFLSGMLALGVVFAAYASEVFTAAFNGIPKGQWEGAEALGLHRCADDAARHRCRSFSASRFPASPTFGSCC